MGILTEYNMLQTKQKEKFENREVIMNGPFGYMDIRLLPYEKPYHPERFDDYINLNTYVFSDPHLSYESPEDLYSIAKMMNKRIKPNDTILCLGDWEGKHSTGSLKLVREFTNILNCKNIFTLVGNNDPWEIPILQKAGGFLGIDVRYTLRAGDKNIILTHCPIIADSVNINMHGHIHNSKTQYNVDWKNHFNVCTQQFRPVTIKECLSMINRDFGFTTVVHDYGHDPKHNRNIIY